MGIYKNYIPTKKRSADRHVIYRAECSMCGKEVFGRKADLCKIIECRHVYSNTLIPILSFKDHQIAKVFSKMVERCYNKAKRDYRWYGAKGVRICSRWLYTEGAFESWYLYNVRDKNITQCYQNEALTIDRIDGTKDYSPDNCRLISRKENARWKSTTMPLTVNGLTLTGRQWAKYIGHGVNFINRYRKQYGELAAIAYISQAISKKAA